MNYVSRQSLTEKCSADLQKMIGRNVKIGFIKLQKRFSATKYLAEYFAKKDFPQRNIWPIILPKNKARERGKRLLCPAPWLVVVGFGAISRPK